MLSRRTKLSLCQYLELQERPFLRVHFEKHELYARYLQAEWANPLMDILQQSVTDAQEQQLHAFLMKLLEPTMTSVIE